MSFKAVGTLALVAATLPLFLVDTAYAQETPGILKFDTNNNGQIDPEEATPAFFSWINRVFMPALASDEPETETRVETGMPSGVTPQDAAPGFVTVTVTGQLKKEEASAGGAVADTEEPQPNYSHALLLRGDASETFIPSEGESLDNATGAFVSYSNDIRQSTEEWQVKGALLYPVRFSKGENKEINGARLTAYTFIPSVSFDRKFDSQDEASELDSLTFQVGSEWEVSGGPWFTKQYFRFGPFYATDFGFEAAIVGGEFQYEALNDKWGLGAAVDCFFGRFSCEWGAILQLDVGKTLEVGDKTNLEEDEDFLTLGPELSFTLKPTFKPLDRLKVNASWYYFEDLSGDSGAADQLTAGISWGLDRNGHVRIRSEYRHGDLPLTRDKITIVTTGLEVKF